MMVPSRKQCLMLMDNHKMPLHIQEHSQQVAGIAIALGRHLSRCGVKLDVPLLEAGGLLHDIAKARCLRTGENHAVVGGQMVREMGYPRVASIVEEHVTISVGDLAGPVSESLLVNYADKRVKHTEVVSLHERFGDLADRYAHTAERRARLAQNLSLFMSLEEKIFANLGIQPNTVLAWGSPPAAGKREASGMAVPGPAVHLTSQ